jgi:sigma-E factor negative regulatory protein RseC
LQEKNMGDSISHLGIVQKTGEGSVFVSIVSQSACAACHAKGACSMSESTEKVVEVASAQADGFAVGDHVEVLLQRSMALKAVMWGYVLPFAVFLSVLIIVFETTGSELWAGFSAILSLLPYYLILSLFKANLKSQFGFRIVKV